MKKGEISQVVGSDRLLDGFTPVLPLKDIVLLPNIIVPINVGRIKSLNAIEVAGMDGDIILLTQKSALDSDANSDNLQEYGTLATILQAVNSPDGSLKVLVEGYERIKINEVQEHNEMLQAKYTKIKTKQDITEVEIKASMSQIVKSFRELSQLNNSLSEDVIAQSERLSLAPTLIDFVATHVIHESELRKQILSIASLRKRLDFILLHLTKVIELEKVEKKIKTQVSEQIEKSNKDYFLREQMAAISKELDGGDEFSELEQLEKDIHNACMSPEAQKKALSELKRLKKMPSSSSESSVAHTYIEHLCSLPWKDESYKPIDLAKAKKILDRDHYGMDKVKERIVEYIATVKRTEGKSATVLCLAGAPGLGKSSIAASVAEALNKKFCKVSLAGVTDSSTLRGHSRTYIGAQAGVIMKELARCESKNPVMLLDEIDKIGDSGKSRPAEVLLDILDSNLNKDFTDHYTDTPFDLSGVTFICTANDLNYLSTPLLDRLEIIEVASYSETEKMHIAKKHLLPKQLKKHGLKSTELNLTSAAMLDVIRYYTSESGVRSLDKALGKICRKVVLHIDSSVDPISKVKITETQLVDYLGAPVSDYGKCSKVNEVGKATGLAYTSVGGDVIPVEALVLKGKGGVHITGSVGDVMKESVEVAYAVVRNKAAQLNIPAEVFETSELRLSFPSLGTPKDGPSASLIIASTIASAFNKIPIKANFAGTGEMDLRGNAKAIGGLREKSLAALRAGITEIFVPRENEKDLVDVPTEVTDKLKIHLVDTVDEVFALVFESAPVAQITV